MFEGYEYMELWANNTLTFRQKVLIDFRIACEEAGYPQQEALFASIEEWEQVTGRNFKEEYAIVAKASAGAD